MTTHQFVLDASVALAWCFEDETSAYADKVLNCLELGRALVPPVWPLEVGNVLLAAERRRRIRRSEGARFLMLLGRLPIVVDRGLPDRSFQEIMELGRETDLSTYDASYLDLAMKMGIPLATQDAKLAKAARKCGAPLFVPANGPSKAK